MRHIQPHIHASKPPTPTSTAIAVAADSVVSRSKDTLEKDGGGGQTTFSQRGNCLQRKTVKSSDHSWLVEEADTEMVVREGDRCAHETFLFYYWQP